MPWVPGDLSRFHAGRPHRPASSMTPCLNVQVRPPPTPWPSGRSRSRPRAGAARRGQGSRRACVGRPWSLSAAWTPPASRWSPPTGGQGGDWRERAAAAEADRRGSRRRQSLVSERPRWTCRGDRPPGVGRGRYRRRSWAPDGRARAPGPPPTPLCAAWRPISSPVHPTRPTCRHWRRRYGRTQHAIPFPTRRSLLSGGSWPSARPVRRPGRGWIGNSSRRTPRPGDLPAPALGRGQLARGRGRAMGASVPHRHRANAAGLPGPGPAVPHCPGPSRWPARGHDRDGAAGPDRDRAVRP